MWGNFALNKSEGFYQALSINVDKGVPLKKSDLKVKLRTKATPFYKIVNKLYRFKKGYSIQINSIQKKSVDFEER